MRRRFHRLLLCVAGVTGVTAGAGSAAAATHPHVLFDDAAIPAMRARLKGPLTKVAKALVGAVDQAWSSGFPKTADRSYPDFASDERTLPDTLVTYAFSSLVFRGGVTDATTEAHAKQLGHDYLTGVCAMGNWNIPVNGASEPDLILGHYLIGASLAYDWLYPDSTDAERSKCRAAIEREAAKMDAAAAPGSGVWWVDEFLQNHCWINHSALGIASIALQGESSAPLDQWLGRARDALGKVHTVIDPIDGAWHEGIGYTDYGLESLVPFGIANARVGGVEYGDVGLVREFARLRMFAMPPAKAHTREYPVWGDFSGFDEGDNALGTFRYAAHLGKDGVLQWYADRFTEGGSEGRAYLTAYPPAQRGLVLSVITHDDALAATPPTTGGAWSLDFEAKDLGVFTSKSGWEIDAGALLALKSGVFGGHWNWERLKVKGAPGGNLDFGHDHDDDANVWFFADGEWLTLDVPGYWIGRPNGSPEANRTKYANALLVDDVGQLGDGPRNDSIVGNESWFWNRTSTLPIKGSTAHFSFVLGAESGLYDKKLGLDTFGRAVLFVDRAIPIVRDVVRGTGTHKYDLTWHAVDGATRDGSWLKLAAKNGRALGIDVVSPADWDMATEAQKVDNLFRFDPDDEMTAVYVHPKTNVAAVTFLSVLAPARANAWSSKPSVTPIDAATPERGVTITGVAGSSDAYDVVMADEPTASATAKGVAIVGMAGVKKTSGGKVVRAMIAAGSSLTIDGTAWITITAGAPASLEVEPSASGVDLSGEAGGARVYAPTATDVRYNGVSVPFDRDGDFVVIPKAGTSLDAGPDGGPGDGAVGPGGDGSVSIDGAPADDGGGSGGDGGGFSGCGCVVAGGESSLGWLGMASCATFVVMARRRRRC